MEFKRICIFCLVMTAFVLFHTGSINGKEEVPEVYREIEGHYEIKFPGKLNNVYYFNYFVKDAKLFSQSLADKKTYELVPEGNDSLAYKHFEGEKIYSHQFFLNKNGQVDRLVVKTGDLILEGIRLKNIKQIKIGERYTKDSLLADFDQMIRIIKYLHPSLYDYTPKDEFENFINEVRGNISRPMELYEFYRLVSPVMAKIGCGHSYLSPPRKKVKQNIQKFLPIRIHFQENKIYIADILNDQYSDLTGHEIISINGLTINEIAEKILNGLSSDWKNIQFKEYLLNAAFHVLYGYFYRTGSSYELETFDPIDKKKKSVTINGMSRDDITMALAERSKHPVYPLKPYSLTILKKRNIALLKIKHFAYYDKKQEKEFFKFIDKSFEKLKIQNIKNLLVDIRGNMGGSPAASQYVLSHLINRPFQYFNKVHTESYKKFFDLMPPSKNGFVGKIITLFDNGCLSTTGHFIALLKYYEVGKFAGIKTGVTFSCTDGSAIISLLNTGMRLKVARERFSAAVKGFKRDEGISPDNKIGLTLEDQLDERDLQLEKAIKLFELK